MPFEIIKNVDKEFHPYILACFMSQKEADKANSFKEKKEVQGSLALCDELNCYICDIWFLFNVQYFIH